MTDNFKNSQWCYENQEPEEEPPVVFDIFGNRYKVVSWSEYEGIILKNIKTGISHTVSEDDFFENYEAE